MEKGLVSCEWLRDELRKSGSVDPIRVVDATWYLPNSPFAAPEDSGGAQADYLAGPRLPGAVFFDIDAVSSPHAAGLPHMLPSEETFSAAMAALGIERSTRVVAYDRHGIFSAPRLWYTLKVAFGHPADVAVLDGGMPRWKELGFPLEEGEVPLPPAPAPMAVWQRVPGSSWELERVRRNTETREALVVDARGAARFLGTAPEPRPGVRSGHIPGSVNVPFADLLTTAAPSGLLRPPEELRERFKAAGVPADNFKAADDLPIVTSCGSGLTACIVGLAMHQLGMPLSRWAVYDGSWSEWGGRSDTQIVRQGADGKEEPAP